VWSPPKRSVIEDVYSGYDEDVPALNFRIVKESATRFAADDAAMQAAAIAYSAVFAIAHC
jgi:hypothetical protein